MTHLDIMAVTFLIAVIIITIPIVVYHESNHMIPKEINNDDI